MQSLRTGCLSDNQVNHLMSGGVDGAELAHIEGHIADCAECRALVGARAGSLVSGDVPVTAEGESTTRHGAAWVPRPGHEAWDAERYDVRGELARGGMGRILEAWDRRHERPVAIKVLLHGGAAIEARFAREVRLTARLQHPSIVALYDAGASPAGEPFFVMKLVLGRSLAAVAADAKSIDERLALLPHLIAATDALAYAHDRRIIHRDLKPANVLVGTFGETVVIDWGLAKDLHDGAEPEADVARDAREDDGSADLTVAGRALGTPCYMAPEQARGEPADERADVYALGALLYHVLAGGPPFAENTSRGVLLKLLSGPPVPLAEREPSLPADIVTIVRKAMARAPAERYATARDMAAELRRFTLGQRVGAHAYSPMTLAVRWVKKRRAIVAMALLLVVGIGVTAGLSIRRVVRERDRADREKAVAEERGRSARAHSEAAEGLVEYAVVELRKQLAPLGKLDLLSGIGGEVEKYYGSLSDLDDVRTASALGRRAMGLDLLGEVAATKHDFPAARDHEQKAIALLERALDANPADRGVRERLALAELRLAGVEQDMGAAPEAIAADRRAETEAQRLVREDGANTSAALLAARAERDLSEHLFDSGNDSEGAESGRVVPALLRRLSAADPGNVDLKLQLANAYIWLGREQGFFGHDDGMVESEREALKALESLDPTDSRTQDAQASALQLSSGAEIDLGRTEDALEHARRSVDLRERLIARDPANTEWQRRLTYALACVAMALQDLGRAADAKPASLRAVRIAEANVEKTSNDATSKWDVAMTLESPLATTLLAAGEPDAALAALHRAQAIVRELAKDGEFRGRFILADQLVLSGRVELAQRRLDRALADASNAYDLAEGLTLRSDDDVLLLQARARGLFGAIHAARGDDAAARPILEAAVTDFDEVWTRGHNRGEWLRDAPDASRALAAVLVRAGDRVAARKILEQASAKLEKLDADGRIPLLRHPLLVGVRADLAKVAP